MPSGEMPSYRYRPPGRSEETAQLRSCSSRRARLFAGGTYFRSREVGLQQNNLSVEVIEFETPDGSGFDATPNPNADAVCVVTNYNLSYDENVTGPATPVLLSMKLKSNEYVKIDQLDQPQSRAQKYSISFKIAPDADIITQLGTFSFSKLFHTPSLLSTKLTPEQSVFTPTDAIIIKPRYQVYRLVAIGVESTDTPGTWTYGWDIADLRAKINSTDPWIEMVERPAGDSGEGGGPPATNPNDVQDTGTDAVFLSPFTETFLSGGDGLPDSPNNERTGPSRSLVHVNYGEAQNGELREVNIVYEWAGDSLAEGSWKQY